MLWFAKKGFVFAYLTTVHEFYGLKASQMSKVCTSSHEYPDAKEIKISVSRIQRSLNEATSVVKMISAQYSSNNGKN